MSVAKHCFDVDSIATSSLIGGDDVDDNDSGNDMDEDEDQAASPAGDAPGGSQQQRSDEAPPAATSAAQDATGPLRGHGSRSPAHPTDAVAAPEVAFGGGENPQGRR